MANLKEIIITGRIGKRINEYQSGDRFERLMLTGKCFRDKTSHLFFECICDCGNICFVVGNNLKSGKTGSCGCKKSSHGLWKHPLYKTWRNILKRCYYVKSGEYKTYGGRGIIVCAEWKDDFKSFYDWAIVNGWEKGLTIDREDNDGMYGPDNCRWVTNNVQQRNKSNNLFVNAFGEIKCLQDWANDERACVGFGAIRNRIFNLKWPAEEAITKESKKGRYGKPEGDR